MGFFFRKSLNFGPFRVNLSKSGVGFSTGVKGFRIGTGPKGAYIHAGRGGFYYRKTLGGKKINASNRSQNFDGAQQGANYATPENYVEIESADTDQLTDVSSKDLLEQINRNNNRTQLWPIGLVCAICCGFLAPYPCNLIGGCAGLIFAYLLYVFHDVKRIPLNYSNDETTQKSIEVMNKIVSLLANCDYKWHIEGFVANNPVSIKRSLIYIQKRKPDFIETNIEVYSIPVGKQTLYFFPDRLYVVEGKNLAIINYTDIEISIKTVEMEERSPFPSDSRLLSQTWEHTNLDGEPDKRYKHNPKICTFEYANILFTSSTGLREAIQVSNPKVGEVFKDCLTQIVRTMKIVALSKDGEVVKTEDNSQSKILLDNDSNAQRPEKPAIADAQQFFTSAQDTPPCPQDTIDLENSTTSNCIASFWDERQREMKEYISKRLAHDAMSGKKYAEIAKIITRFITEDDSGLSGSLTGATVDNVPTYIYAEKDKHDLPAMLRCCRAELKNMPESGVSPAPFYFERVAILARKEKNYELEIKICKMLIYAFDLYDDARQHCGIELYPYIKGSPRYENIVKRLPKAKILLAKRQSKY